MDVRIMVQSTPNPNALKFVLNVPVKMEGKATFKNATQAENVPLAQALFTVANVIEVYFFENYITITQDGNADWDALEEQVQRIILEQISQHDPNFKLPSEENARKVSAVPSSPEIDKIEGILNQTIRPALQMDGGDLQIMEFENNVLKINYQGACGSCPSSTMGTLKAIEGILRDEYNPDIVVELAN